MKKVTFLLLGFLSLGISVNKPSTSGLGSLPFELSAGFQSKACGLSSGNLNGKCTANERCMATYPGELANCSSGSSQTDDMAD